ncbi:MAG TPA: PH domain-containing protein [Euzebyales bacterium]
MSEDAAPDAGWTTDRGWSVTADDDHDPDGDPTIAPADERPRLGGRLHPSVIAVWSVRGLAPLAAVWIASDAGDVVFGIMLLILLLGGSWMRWLRFTWRVERGHLVIERGLLQRTRRVIPLARIQAVQTVRKVQHRVFGVVGLRVEAIGGSETEGQLDALSVDLARDVQQALLRQEPAEQATTSTERADAGDRPVTSLVIDEAPPGTVIAQCPPARLLLAGLTGGRVGVAAALIGLAEQFYGQRIAETALSAPQRYGLRTALVFVALGIVAAFVLSVAATAVTYWDFTVRRDGGLLRLHRGLLDERRDTVPLTRVQTVTVEQNILRRAFGLAAVRMTVAGRAGDDAGVTGTLLPIGSLGQALRLVDEAWDHTDMTMVDLHPMPIAARSRRLVRAATVTVALTAAVWPFAGAGAALVASAAVAVLGTLVALASYRSLGWAVEGDVVMARSGWLVRRLSVTPVGALQSVRLSSSPFQRRRGLATLRLEIARSRGGRDPRLIDLTAADAGDLQARLAIETVRARSDVADPRR